MLTRYNAKDCTVSVANVAITGLGATMVTGEKDEEFFTPMVGAQGDIVKSVINNELGTVTITVQPTSPQKSHLLGLAKQTETFPLWVTNPGLRERFGGSQASLKNYPSMSHGAEAEDMEFVFTVFDYAVTAT